MKNLSKLLYLAVFAGLMFGNSVSANNQNNGFGFNKLVQSLCENAGTDRLTQLRRSLRQAKAHIRAVYPDVQCNGQSLLSLAVLNHSDRVIAYLKLKAKPEIIPEQNQQLSAK